MTAPLALLDAWAAAWPWAAPSALSLPSELPSDHDESFGSSLVDWLRPRAGGRSVTELKLIRQGAWAQHRRLTDLLLAQVRERLRSDGDAARVKLGADGAWRYLRWTLPMDVLLGAAMADGGPNGVVPKLGSGSRQLEVSLRRLCDTHLHVFAALDFPSLWSAWMGRLAGPDDDLVFPSDTPLGSSRDALALLYAAAIARLWLRAVTVHGGDTAVWERGAALQDAAHAVRALGKGPGAVAELGWVWLRRRYRELCFDRGAADPLATPGRAALQDGATFWGAALRLGPEVDPVVHQLLRVEVALFRHATQEPGTFGLEWFVRANDQAGAVRPNKLAVLRHALAQPDRLAIEPRTVPPVALGDLIGLVGDLALAAREQGRADLESGWIFHFVKTKERRPTFPRYRAWYRDARSRAFALRRLLVTDPWVLALVRGLDVANEELCMPLWPVAPILRSLREASRRAVARSGASTGLEPLRLTVHAGEEYPHPIAGLRRVHELVEFGILEQGDRIGHGVVLAAGRHSSSAGAPLPKEDLLDDLCWELDRYRLGDLDPPSAGRLTRIEERIRALTHELHGGPMDEAVARDLRRDRFDADRLAAVEWFPHPAACRSEPERDPWLRQSVFDAEFAERARTPTRITEEDVSPEVVRPLRAMVRRSIVEREITVETNPSSNHLIGVLDRFRDHPLFSFSPPDGAVHPDGPRLLCSVNTDDPIVFATTLHDELASVHAAAEADFGSSVALRWVEELVDQGRRSRFTLAVSTEARLLEELSGWSRHRRR